MKKVKLTPDEVIDRMGGQYDTADEIGVCRSAVRRWKHLGFIPPLQAIIIENITNGKIKAVDIITENPLPKHRPRADLINDKWLRDQLSLLADSEKVSDEYSRLYLEAKEAEKREDFKEQTALKAANDYLSKLVESRL